MLFSPSNRFVWVASSPLRVWRGGGLLALLLLAGTVAPATAQVSLQLLHRVDSTGQIVFEGRPLPSQTRVVLLRYPAERPHTLENAGIPRKELARLILTRLRSRDTTIRLDEEGKTPRRYPLTAQSNRVLYVLARTPADSLYESYVNTGNGFAPGFDAVQSGRMTMGLVTPRRARRRYRAVFRLSREAAPSGSETASGGSSEARTGAGAEAGDSASARATAAQEASTKPTSPSEDEGSASPVWIFLLGGLVGGLIGSGVAWWIFSDRLRRAEEERTELQRELRKVKNREFREATGTTLSTPPESSEDPPTDGSPDEIKQLRERNETLEHQIQQIKKYLRNLRDSDD